MTTTSHAPLAPARILVLVSGLGSTMQALVEASEDPGWGGRVVAVGADRQCAGLEWAQRRGIATFSHPLSRGGDRGRWDVELTELVAAHDPDLVVCAGFMKLLGGAFLARFGGRVLNTHNSLLPAFPGTHAPADALAAGVKVAGATLFVVDAGVDTGAILAQVTVPVEEGDTAETLLERIKVAERAQLADTVGRMLREGWRTRGASAYIGA